MTPVPGYTSAMSVSVFLARYRLLLCVGLLSVVLHLLAVLLVDLRIVWPVPGADAPLAVRIAPARPLPVASPAPIPPSVPDLIDVFFPESVAVPALRTLERDAAAPPEDIPDAPSDSLARADQDDVRPADESPGYYQSSPSSSARVDYRLTLAGPGTATRDDGSARLTWETDGSSYRLELDGVLGHLSSEGGLDDMGVAPRRALEPLGAGRATTLFDRQQQMIVSAIGAWRAPLFGGSQDTGSVLLQLGGMGRSMETQLLSVTRIWVGGAPGARLERYRMMGRETIETGIGAIDAVHLVRLAPPDMPDAPLLEVWFAPAHAWLPVQLRLTTADGQVRTQTVSAIEAP